MILANRSELRRKAEMAGDRHQPDQPARDKARSSRAATASVAALVGSSEFRALGDDALKDEDNAAWVLGLEADTRREWLRRLHWIRLADRLAENERFEPEAGRFRRFCDGWRTLVERGSAAGGTPPTMPPSAGRHAFADVLDEIGGAWLAPSRDEACRLAAHAWDDYLEALGSYHRAGLAVETLADHDVMLERLSGRIFQMVPYLRPRHAAAAAGFGALDQYFNNLRDLAEDAQNGVSYFPADVLARFGVARESILDGSCIGGAGFTELMRYWTGEYLDGLAARAAELAFSDGDHPSLHVMQAWCLRRHERTLRVLRVCRYDYRLFPRFYWPAVRRELSETTA
jgi:phytoene synthase